MRIWMLTSELPHQTGGGIARFVGNYARLAGAAGHEVVVIGPSNDATNEQVAPGVRFVGFIPRSDHLHKPGPTEPDEHPAYPYNVIASGLALSWEMSEEVLRLLGELPAPDIIESQEYAALPYYLLHRKLIERTPLDGIPILVHLHGPLFELLHVNQEPRHRFPEYWIGQMERACILMADALLTPSRFLAGRVERSLGRTLDITRIPYPVAEQNGQPPRDGRPGEVVYVGRLQVLKGVLPMVAGCSRLWAAGHDFRLTMIGADTPFGPRDMSVREFLERRYRRWIDDGKLKLAGVLAEHSDVLDHLRNAWAAIIPSLWENFPNVCIEAMTGGQIVVASRTGGQAEMVGEDGVNGFIFDWSNPGEFETKLEQALSLDPQQRGAMARRAQQRIRQLCATDAVLEQRFQHYQHVIDNYRPRRTYPAASEPKRGEPASTPPDQPCLLSVVIPYYNLGAYVKETLDSVAQSTYEPIEIVIINDGSTEPNSIRVLEEIAASGMPNLRVVHCENQGLAATRNRGADEARGEYVFFLDADDLVDPDFFTRAIHVLDRFENVDFVYPWVRYFDGSTGLWPTWNTEFPYLLGHNMASGGFSVVRRSSFLQHGRNKPAVEYSLEDFEMWVSMVSAGCVGVSLPWPLVRYRVRADSMWQTSNPHQHQYLYDLITHTHPEMYRKWGVELFNLQNANGPARLWNHPGGDAFLASSSDVATLRHHSTELEKARTWLEGRQRNHEEIIKRQEDAIKELRQWAQELQEAKAWMEQQWRASEAEQDRLRKRWTLSRLLGPGRRLRDLFTK